MAGVKTAEQQGPPETETDQPGLELVRNAVHNRIWIRLPKATSLRRDAIAGLSSAISNVPDGMANGALLGVSPVHGLYGTMVGPAVGGALSSTQLMMITTMAAVTRDTARLHESVTAAVERQLQALATSSETSTGAMTTLWQQALDQQRVAQAALADATRERLDDVGTRFTGHAAALADAVATQLDASATGVTRAWDAALERQQAQHAELVEQQQAALVAAGDQLGARAQVLLDDIAASHTRLQEALASGDGERLA